MLEGLPKMPARYIILVILGLLSCIQRAKSQKYTACSLYSPPTKATICSDYMKSTNDTHFLVPFSFVTEVRDPFSQKASTIIEESAQIQLEAAVLAAIKTMKFFPFLDKPCQNSLIGSICSAYFPSCSALPCPQEQPLIEQFKYCNPQKKGESFKDDGPVVRSYPSENVFNNIELCAANNCDLVTKHCPLIHTSTGHGTNITFLSKSIVDIFQLKQRKIFEVDEEQQHREIYQEILPRCFDRIDCYNPNSSFSSLDMIIGALDSRFDLSLPYASNVCDSYANMVTVKNGTSWNGVLRKMYKYTASFIAESGVPSWLPLNCSSGLKQLVCASIFDNIQPIKNQSLARSKESDGVCEDVCLYVEEHCETLFNLPPSIFDKVTNNFSLYPFPIDLYPRLRTGGSKVFVQQDFDVYEGGEYDKCRSVLNGGLPHMYGYPFPGNFNEEAVLLNNLVNTLREHNTVMGVTRTMCNLALSETHCNTCIPRCPNETIVKSESYFTERGKVNLDATYTVLSSACAVPCPFNTRSQQEYKESIMLRFVGGAAGIAGGMFIIWIWLAEPGLEEEKTLNALFFAGLLLSIVLVTGPAFEPFRYFCRNSVHVATQNSNGLNMCVFEAVLILFGVNLFALLWFCLVIERITVEIFQRPGALVATPTTFKDHIWAFIRYVFNRFVNFPRPESSDARRFPIYCIFSIGLSSILVYVSWYQGLLGYDGLSSWCSYVHPNHINGSTLTSTSLHYGPLASTFTIGLSLLSYRLFFHIKQLGWKEGLAKGVFDRMSVFLFSFGFLWNFMVYKKLTSQIRGRLDRESSAAEWHRCLLLNVSAPVSGRMKNTHEVDSRNNASYSVPCSKLPKVRLDHNIALWIDALISGGGWFLLMIWGTSMIHIRFIMEEFGFTRSGLTWYGDRDREQQIILDEIRRHDKE